jgi:hypothetical protein
MKDLFNRVKLEPSQDNWTVLGDWIETLDLESGADAIVNWANIIHDRTIELDDWLHPKQSTGLVEPPYDLSVFDRLVISHMEWNLSGLLETFDRYYPPERQAVTPVEIEEIRNAIIEDEDPLAIAHDENIEVWVKETLDRVDGRIRSFSSLSRGRSTVQVWLSILLSEGRINALRSRGSFYERRGIIVTEAQEI